MGGRWFDRKFDLGLTVAAFPEILGRLRAAPDRVEEAVRGLAGQKLRAHAANGGWSIQEHVGHLLDLEQLWEQRLDDFDGGARILHPADLENRKTHEANHNARRIEDLLSEFRTARLRIVVRLQPMTAAQLSRTALHPRLQQPMSLVDLGFFVAEHDDHHLATIAALIGGQAP